MLPGAEVARAARPCLPEQRKKKTTRGTPVLPKTDIALGGLRLSVPKPTAPVEKPKREPRPRAKNDPKLVAAARELRDRWMEEINSGRYLPAASGKYEMSRVLEERAAPAMPTVAQL